ncbi:MAG: DUF2793 domain-containing protein [Erythrobacter sp.]|nr:DUF2793 domain-containing protein [Erythrobacter sp.]
MNEALARLDLLTQPSVADERADPPTSAIAGDCYLIAANATGEWTGKDGALAGWDGTQWTIAAPKDGMLIRDTSQSTWLIFSGAWQRLAAPAEPSGGSVVDVEARAVLANLLAALKDFGIFS